MPVFVLAGIYLGWFSPTEAGGFACLYAILVGRYVYREMSWSDVLEAATRAAIITSQILIIVATAALSLDPHHQRGAASHERRANEPEPAALGLPHGGECHPPDRGMLVLDPTSAIIVLTPLFMPLVRTLGINPIHFGIVMTVNIAIGMFTPPFGLNIFVARSVWACRSTPSIAVCFHFASCRSY